MASPAACELVQLRSVVARILIEASWSATDGMQAPPSPTSQRGVQQAPPSPVMEPLDEPKSFTDKPKKSFTETLGVSASVFHAVVQAHGPSFDNMKSSLGIQAALSIEQRGLTSSGKKNSKKKNKKVSKQPDGFAFTITATDSKQLATATAGLRKVIQHAEAAEAQKQQLATKKQLALKQQQQQRKEAELAARRTDDARRSRDRKELDAVRSNSSSTKALIEDIKRKKRRDARRSQPCHRTHRARIPGMPQRRVARLIRPMGELQ